MEKAKVKSLFNRLAKKRRPMVILSLDKDLNVEPIDPALSLPGFENGMTAKQLYEVMKRQEHQFAGMAEDGSTFNEIPHKDGYRALGMAFGKPTLFERLGAMYE